MRAPQHEFLVVTIAVWPQQRSLLGAFAFSAAAVQAPTLALIVAGEGENPALATSLASAAVRNEYVRVASLPDAVAGVPAEGSGARFRRKMPLEGSDSLVLSRKWTTISTLLGHGSGVLYADVDVVLAHPPFQLSANDSDVEVLSEGFDAEGGAWVHSRLR